MIEDTIDQRLQTSQYSNSRFDLSFRNNCRKELEKSGSDSLPMLAFLRVALLLVREWWQCSW
jgi:hypothetical protein